MIELSIGLLVLECIGVSVGHETRAYAANCGLASEWIVLAELTTVTLAAIATVTAVYLIMIILGIA